MTFSKGKKDCSKAFKDFFVDQTVNIDKKKTYRLLKNEPCSPKLEVLPLL
jgi:hypothetical protein